MPRKSRTHDTLVRQAMYNTGANIFIIIAGLGIVALYWVLESFFRPLMWAILCGAFLHPFKHSLTKNVKNWLWSLKESGTPLSIGVVIVPLNILDSISESLLQSLQKRWRVILIVFLVFSALYVTYLQAPMDFKQFTALLWDITTTISDVISFFNFKWVCGIIITYLFTVLRFWSAENKVVLSYMAVPIWALTLLCIISNAGAFRLPLAVIILVLIAVGIYTNAKENRRLHLNIQLASSNTSMSEISDIPGSAGSQPSPSSQDITIVHQFQSFSDYFINSFNNLSFSSTNGQGGEDTDDTDGSDVETSTQQQPSPPSSPVLGSPTSLPSSTHAEPGQVKDNQHGDTGRHPSVSESISSEEISERTSPQRKEHLKVTFSNDDVTSSGSIEELQSSPWKMPQISEESSPPQSPTPSLARQQSQDSQGSNVELRITRKESDRYFIFLFWAIVLVTLWSNVRLILLPFVAIIYRLLKFIVAWLQQHFTEELHEHLRVKVQPIEEWCTKRLEVIVPPPIRAVVNILLKGDYKLLDILFRSADSFITVLLMCLLLVGFVVLSIWFCFQVQKEGIHLITVTSNLVQNSTIESQWLATLLQTSPNDTVGENIHSRLDPMVKNLYSFGRDYIETLLAERITHKQSRELLQNELINIWDSLYASWVTKNTTMIAKPDYHGALFSHIRSGEVDLWHSLSVDMSGVFNFVRENIGLFQSVVESLWILLKGNINIAFSLFITVMQFILGGGTAILNSIISLFVFFTTLFYLLASSSKDYKPVEWITRMTIAKSGSKFAQAVEDGIGGVFAASLKMAAFYGVYTWLTHTVFGINIVFLPAALAAVLGAIPFVGTYWAAAPAVLELCLIHQEVFLGLLLAMFHLAPTFFVDLALYGDIKGGGHPYLTGLAIAGGIYCFGLEGAIIGPVLLCCIIVSMNLYSAVINPDSYPFTPLTPGSYMFMNRFDTSAVRRSVSSFNL